MIAPLDVVATERDQQQTCALTGDLEGSASIFTWRVSPARRNIASVMHCGVFSRIARRNDDAHLDARSGRAIENRF